MGNERVGMMRARWAAFGAAVAVAVGGGGLAITHAVSSGERSVFVSVVPCRLVDTRPAPDTVGPRPSPLGAGEVYTQQVTGSVGNCVLPAGATAVALNVTAVGATGPSFLVLFPADAAAVPTASNLNYQPGSAPSPNKVDVRLSPGGAMKLFNAFGAVNVIVDVVGYYVDHDHDDRYYPKTQTYARAEVDAKKAIVSSGPRLGSGFSGVFEFPLLSETYTAPAAGVVVISRSLGVSGACTSGSMAVFLTVDTIAIGSSYVNVLSTADVMSVSGEAPVTAGSHTVGLGVECSGPGTWTSAGSYTVGSFRYVLYPT